MPTLLNVFEKVRAIAARELDAPIGGVLYESRLDHLFSDSLEFVDFILCLKAEIGPISDIQVTKAETIGDLIDAFAVPN